MNARKRSKVSLLDVAQMNWFTYQNTTLSDSGQWLVPCFNTLQYLVLPEELSWKPVLPEPSLDYTWV